MFGGISKVFSICKYPFYELKSRKQRIAPDDPVSHYYGTCVGTIDEHKSIGVHRIDLYVNGISMTYFDSFGVEYISEKIKRFIGNKNIITNILIIQAYDLMMSEYFCIGFIDSMVEGKILTDFTTSSSHNFWF